MTVQQSNTGYHINDKIPNSLVMPSAASSICGYKKIKISVYTQNDRQHQLEFVA
jgi:hypothetical protein